MALTENVKFKLKYRKYLDIALAISLSLHLLAFALIPKIDINPYKTNVDELEVIDIPPEIEIPPPPKEIERPKIPVETLDADVEDEEDLDDTSLDLDDFLNAPPPPPPGGGDFFVFDKAPKPKTMVSPEYPTMARTSETEGIVRVKVTVDENGRVVSASIVSTAAAVFNESALAAIRQWTFFPAEQSGNPVKATIIIPLSFKLNR
jgi:TonB family protein